MIFFNKVKKKYKNKLIFDKVTFKIDKPGLYLIVGENGEGKSTLINIIGGFIKFKGKVINYYKNNLRCLFQRHYLIEYLTIKENLELFNIDINILKKFDLFDKKDVYPNTLSSGQIQKIGFIISMFSNGDLILLDEPLNNLDKINSNKIKEEIILAKRNKIIFVVTHRYKEFLKYATGIIRINNKKIKYIEKNNKVNKLNASKSKIKVTNKVKKIERKYYSKFNFKMYSLMFIVLSLLSITTISKYFINKLINEDIEACLDYNKIYLKECEYVLNNGFTISKCNNPSENKLKELEDSNISYGLNYDYVLNHLYNREDLFVINNSKVKLSSGEYPKNMYQVIASNKYRLGQTLTLKASSIVRGKEVDVYMENVSLEIVGIYKELKFIKEDVIYFDYKIVDQFFKETILKNNQISIYEYYNNLEINNYKYISFYDLGLKNIEGDNVKYEFYEGIKDVVSKLESLLNYLDLLIIILGWYIIYKLNKIKLLAKQKSSVFMLSNSISKRDIINSYLIYDVIVITIITFTIGIVALLITKNLICIKRYILFLISIIMIFYFQSLKFLSRKNISKLMGEEE